MMGGVGQGEGRERERERPIEDIGQHGHQIDLCQKRKKEKKEKKGEGETHRRHRTTWPSDRSLPATQTMTPLASVPLKAPSTHDPHRLSLVVLVQTSSSLRDACAFVATHAEQRCVHPLPPLPCSRLHLLLRLFQSRSLAWPCLAFSPPLSHALCPRCQCILPWCRRAWVGAPPKG